MTSIEQLDVQAVLAGIDDLLPVLRERAQLTEDLRQVPQHTTSIAAMSPLLSQETPP